MPSSHLHTCIETFIKEHSLCASGDCLIVAVSGGADSVALLDLLASLPCYSFRLIVAHLNHLLRGDESDRDEQFVQQLAARYGLPCEVSRTDVRQLAHERRLSLEEAGREARYSFFEQLRQAYSATAIAVAHHADDQAETLLMRLLRGAGIGGLSAMAPRTAQAVIRPLLTLSRTELRMHLDSIGLSFREDSSNQDRSFLRNRVRHELLPKLATYNPAIAERLAATASLLGEDELLLEQITRQAWQLLATEGTGWVGLQRRLLQEQPLAMRLRLYRSAMIAVNGNLRRIERKHCLSVERLLQEGQTGSRVSLPKEMTALLTSNHLLLAHRALLRPQPPLDTVITSPGLHDLGNGLQLLVEQAAVPSDWRTLPPHVSYIDGEQAPFPWELRPARPSDRIEPLGMTGSQLVRNIVVDAKLPRHLRSSLPLLLHNGTPLWLPPLRRSRLALLPAGRTHGLRLTLLGCEWLPLFP